MRIILRNISIILVACLLPGLCCAPAHASEAVKLCVQLKWHHQSQFAGFYLAKERGYYAAEGLDLEFVPGGPQVDWQARMREGGCAFGITTVEEIVLARAAGTRVKAVAAIDQISPIVWFALRDSGIWNPRQFKGRRVVLVPTGRLQFLGMLERVGLSPADMDTSHPFSLDMRDLYSRKVEVWSGYHTNLVTKAEDEGHYVTVMHAYDYGVQVYDDVIYASEDFMAGQPEAALGFLRASMRGWMDAIRQPEAAVRASMPYMDGGSAQHEMRLFMRTIPYVHTGEVPIGWMEESVWEEIVALMKRVGMLDDKVKASDVFDMSLLRKLNPGGAAR